MREHPREPLEEGRIPRRHGLARRAEVRPQIRARDLVSTAGYTAAHGVEQGIGEVPPARQLVRGELEAVDARHDAHQVAGAQPDVHFQLGAEVGIRREEPDELGDRRRILADVVFRQLDPRADEVRAPPAADEVLVFELLAGAVPVQLRRAEKPARRLDALGPDGGRPQCLVRLVAIRGDRAQPKQGQPTRGVELTLLVGVRESAELHLECTRQTIGQHVLDAVHHVELHGPRCQVEDGRAPDETEALAGHPCGGE